MLLTYSGKIFHLLNRIGGYGEILQGNQKPLESTDAFVCRKRKVFSFN